MLGPIFRVELVSIARRRRYFVLRVLYASLILMVLWATYESSNVFNYGPARQSIQQAAALAAGFFISFSWLQLLAILFVGPAMAVGTIATERERRTIEYLFVTDLSNSEIVLGKTFARLTLMAQLVLVGLPILFLFRLLGGIPAEALLASFLSAAGTAVMLTGLSIAVSVWSPKARDATVRIYLLLIALFTLPLMLYGFHRWEIINDTLWTVALEPLADALWLINPLTTLTQVTGRSFAVGLGWGLADVLPSLGAQLGVAVASLLLALSSVRRVHLAETTKSADLKPRKLEIPKFRRPLGARPMLWKEMYSSTSQTALGRIGWGAILLMMIGVIVSTILVFIQELTNPARSHDYNNYFQYLAALSGYLGTGMLLLMAVRAAGLFAQEKERDCWITLLSTPLTGEEIVNGKLLGNLYSTRWLWGLLFLSWLLGIVFNPLVLYPLAVTMLTLLLVSVYTTCLGLFFSLRSATSLRAMAQTLGMLIFFGGGYLFCCCIVLRSNVGGRDSEIILALCIPFLICFPGIAFTSMDSSYFWDGTIPAAYIIGLFVHLIAAGSLYAVLIRSFDNFSGRTYRAEGLSGR
jgi:ABC-type transport system involved in multi-copper enzyme maturation permease subunit